MRYTSSSASAGIYTGMAIGKPVGTMVGLAKAGQTSKRLSGVKRLTRIRLPRGHLSGAFGLKPRRCGVEDNHVENRSLAAVRNEGRGRPSRARSAVAAGASRTAAGHA